MVITNHHGKPVYMCMYCICGLTHQDLMSASCIRLLYSLGTEGLQICQPPAMCIHDHQWYRFNLPNDYYICLNFVFINYNFPDGWLQSNIFPAKKIFASRSPSIQMSLFVTSQGSEQAISLGMGEPRG